MSTVTNDVTVIELSAGTPKYGHNGYIGDTLCDENGYFDPIPTLEIHFTESSEAIIPGVTITWSTVYNEWATEYRVTAYHGDRKIFVQTETGNQNVISVMAGDISEYDKVVLEVLAWSKPEHRARLENIFLGIEKIYTKADLMDFSADMSVDPLSASLPKSEITFSITNLNNEFNPDNPSGEAKYLMERQTLNVKYGYKLGADSELADENGIEWINGGEYYLSEWETPQNGITASFTARDALEFMNALYAGPQNGTLMEIATAAFEQANLPLMQDGSVRWRIDSSLDSISAPLVEIGEDGKPTNNNGSSNTVDLHEQSIAVVLQYVANAACCVFYQDRIGLIHLEPLKSDIQDYDIDRFNSYANSEITLSKQLKSININNGQHIMQVGKVGEDQPISNPLISDEQAPIVAAWVASYLQNRRTLSGSFRTDPRLDPLDLVHNENQFARAVVLVTEAQFTYNGAFKGSYSGRSIMSALAYYYYSGDLFSGEV